MIVVDMVYKNVQTMMRYSSQQGMMMLYDSRHGIMTWYAGRHGIGIGQGP